MSEATFLAAVAQAENEERKQRVQDEKREERELSAEEKARFGVIDEMRRRQQAEREKERREISKSKRAAFFDTVLFYLTSLFTLLTVNRLINAATIATLLFTFYQGCAAMVRGDYMATFACTGFAAVVGFIADRINK